MKLLATSLLIGALALTGCDAQPEGKPVARAKIDGSVGAPAPMPSDDATIASQVESACRSVIFENTSLTHCLAIPSRHRIETALANASGENYRSLAKLAEAMDGDTVAFAMNAGMYDGEGKPIGYYVQNKDRLQELNRNDGSGNFHLKPNGVFYGTGGTWRIKTSDNFYSTVGDRPDFGTQSGPMLLIEGKVHPQISEDGPSKRIRNGVGVDRDGKAHFVIAASPVSFGQFARYFRDVAKTPNALYLDGTVSSLWDPARGRMDTRADLGPLVVVETKE